MNFKTNEIKKCYLNKKNNELIILFNAKYWTGYGFSKYSIKKKLINKEKNNVINEIICDDTNNNKIIWNDINNNKIIWNDTNNNEIWNNTNNNEIWNNTNNNEIICDDNNEEYTYIYSDCEPDKARTIYPCFDQPDIKATYK